MSPNESSNWPNAVADTPSEIVVPRNEVAPFQNEMRASKN